MIRNTTILKSPQQRSDRADWRLESACGLSMSKRHKSIKIKAKIFVCRPVVWCVSACWGRLSTLENYKSCSGGEKRTEFDWAVLIHLLGEDGDLGLKINFLILKNVIDCSDQLIGMSHRRSLPPDSLGWTGRHAETTSLIMIGRQAWFKSLQSTVRRPEWGTLCTDQMVRSNTVVSH